MAPTDFLHLQWHTDLAVADVLAAAGRPADARGAVERALAVATAKECQVGVVAAQERLERLSP